MPGESRRQLLEARLSQLVSARSLLEPKWKRIGDLMLPFRIRFTPEEINRTIKDNLENINSTAAISLGVLTSGMMAGITSPSKNWFRLSSSDTKLSAMDGFRAWLSKCERIISETLARSNWYSELSGGGYWDLSTIGTTCIIEDEDPKKPGSVRFETVPVGAYWLDVDAFGRVDTMFRVLVLTARQMKQRFGEENLSRSAKDAIRDNKLDQTFRVYHAIHPNEDIKPGMADYTGKPWSSCWWEHGGEPDKLLYQSGYEEFPVLAPRWSVRPGEVYGYGPGWDIVGDCAAMQLLERRLQAMIDKTTSPPMRAYGAMRGRHVSLYSADITYVPNGQKNAVEPMMEVPPQAIDFCAQSIARHENRIRQALHENIWTAFLNDERQQRPTATEVEAVRQEAMLQLGPLLENLNHGLLEPAIDRTFNILARAGKLPDPAEYDLEPDVQVELTVEFISIAHTMQKATRLGGIRTMIAEVNNLALAGRTDALDKLDVDAIIDEVAEVTGVKPELVHTQEEADALRQARAQAQQEQAMTEQAAMGAKGIADISKAAPDGAGLDAVANMLSPVAAAQGGINP